MNWAFAIEFSACPQQLRRCGESLACRFCRKISCVTARTPSEPMLRKPAGSRYRCCDCRCFGVTLPTPRCWPRGPKPSRPSRPYQERCRSSPYSSYCCWHFWTRPHWGSVDLRTAPLQLPKYQSKTSLTLDRKSSNHSCDLSKDHIHCGLQFYQLLHCCDATFC